MAGAGEALGSGDFAKGTEGTLRAPASHGLLHYACRGVPAQTSCCGNKHLTENRAGRKKNRGLVGSAVVCATTGAGKVGVSLIPQGQASGQGPAQSPAWQRDSPSLMTR